MKTKGKHFKLFLAEAMYWWEKLHLCEWRVTIEHRDSVRLPDSLAWNFYDSEGRRAVVGLSKVWENEPITDSAIARCAFHEIAEILIADLHYEVYWDCPASHKGNLERIRHSIIRRLEHVLWEPDYLKRV